ncbi:MAG: polysaccharide biosynthesis/export family protein, partial [Acinetobacter sp.]|nr:polysaccharide biosynthesis/export family protein [Acinetobacter sp.]
MRHFKSIILLSVIMTSTGCALTSGLQTYDLPEEGIYQTDLGTHVNVVKLTQTSLPAVQLAQYNQEYFAHLFNIPQKNYKLSAGDILSIYLWAYPEITPPTNTISNEEAIKSNGYQIDQSGYIQFPIIGRYKAAGKSLTQVN